MGCGSSTMANSKYELQPSMNVVEERVHHNRHGELVPEEKLNQSNSESRHIQSNPEEVSDGFNVNQLKEPLHLTHAKMGNTLCANSRILLLQDGSTSIEFRTPPKFQATIVPWRFGLVRDIIWCSDLNVFLLLTKNHLLSVSPSWLTTVKKVVTNKPLMDFPISLYENVKPFNRDVSFWRCTCVGTNLFICYSGYGTIIEQYSLGTTPCKLTARWKSPRTCAMHEGIWCIRYSREVDLLGMTVMDATNNQWRFELRATKTLDIVWRTVLPITHGDCELSVLPKAEWLVINSCGIRLVQIANHTLKAGVEYLRELKNAVMIGDAYFAVRTKATIEVHGIKSSK